jgi:hypothetical protein
VTPDPPGALVTARDADWFGSSTRSATSLDSRSDAVPGPFYRQRIRIGR